MILICPQCKKKHDIDEKRIPPKAKFAKCKYCENVYTSQSGRSKHMKKCKLNITNNIITEKNNEIKDIKLQNLEDEIKRLQRESREKEKLLKLQAKEKEELLKQQLEKTEKQLTTYEKMLQSMTSPQTINYFNYIVQNYPNAPPLKEQESYTNLLESKTMTLIDVICMYYNDNKLVHFIGDYIVKIYTHKEPDNQSLWTTDISRLTYIINESCKGGTNWIYDKKGAKTKKTIIEPALQFIRNELFKFCQENGSNTKAHILKKMIACNSIILAIDSGDLSDKINKYIAPEFSFKDKDKVLIKHI